MPPDADTRSSADQQYFDSLTARQLMDFRDYLFSPTYISLNAGKFLDDKWEKVGLFREYVQRIGKSSMLDVSSTRPSVPNSAPIKIESLPPILPSSVKAEPEKLSPHRSGDVKMRALTEDGHEILELLSDSDAEEDLNSDLEVMEALRRSSRSSSVIAPSIPDSTVDDDLDGDIGGGLSHDNQDFAEFPEGDRPAENDFSPADNFPLVESDTIWEDGGKSFVRNTGGTSHRHQYFVGCSGWTKKFKDNHRTHAIPDHVDEHLLIKALVGRPMAPMALPAASEPGAIAAKLRRRRQEVDEADIPPENSKRARAPSTRKRGTQDKDISDPDQPQKKKGKRNARYHEQVITLSHNAHPSAIPLDASAQYAHHPDASELSLPTVVYVQFNRARARYCAESQSTPERDPSRRERATRAPSGCERAQFPPLQVFSRVLLVLCCAQLLYRCLVFFTALRDNLYVFALMSGGRQSCCFRMGDRGTLFLTPTALSQCDRNPRLWPTSRKYHTDSPRNDTSPTSRPSATWSSLQPNRRASGTRPRLPFTSHRPPSTFFSPK
ncbi:hypothetical protein K438DRAFT_1973954 [Mycena galopus ATCC 62051]|nr:hypothetical protein K438DRAFT_1973954 [Mycena galopus ATCC 62051]